MSTSGWLRALAGALDVLRSRGRDRDAIERALQAFAEPTGLLACFAVDLSRSTPPDESIPIYSWASPGEPRLSPAISTSDGATLGAALAADSGGAALELAGRLLGCSPALVRPIVGRSNTLGWLGAVHAFGSDDPGDLAEALELLAAALAPELEGDGADDSIRPSHALLALVMDNIPQHIFWKDRAGRYLGCNRNFAVVAGVGEPEKIVGKTDFDLAWSQEESEFFRECDFRVMHNDAPEFHIIEPQHQAGGRKAWLDTNKVPLHDQDGQVIGILGTYEDITARLQLEEQLHHAHKMEAVGRLAGGLAHDFKNLMMVVIGQSELARRATSDDSRREIIDAIEQAGQRTARLADKLLMLARRQITRPEVVDVSELIRPLIPVIRRAVPENIELVLALTDNVAIRVDPSAFEQVLLNLVFNAKDAMPEGGKLAITTRRAVLDESHPDWSPEARDGEHLCLLVSDTGIGMSKEVRTRAFEPFFTTKGIGKGTGLGLSIVYGAVKQAGGHLALDSAPESGTSFRVYLPRAKQIAVSLPAPPSRVTSQQRESVLVVEDEPQVRKLAVALLTELGHHALEASNGQEALRVAAQHPELTVLLTDFVMPILGGREFLARFRQTFPAISIVCMSGYTGTPDEIEQALSIGVRFLPKPFTLSELAETLSVLRREVVPAAAAG
ncbi:MAG TPA: ATP-binding protein [Polyangiaceae bacterium]|nr:ATP-binding protein [Polyangiaceae bacterium]